MGSTPSKPNNDPGNPAEPGNPDGSQAGQTEQTEQTGQTGQTGGGLKSKYVKTNKRKMCKDGITRVIYNRGIYEYVRMKNKKTRNIEYKNYSTCKPSR